MMHNIHLTYETVIPAQRCQDFFKYLSLNIVQSGVKTKSGLRRYRIFSREASVIIRAISSCKCDTISFSCFSHFTCNLLLNQKVFTEHAKEPIQCVCRCVLDNNVKSEQHLLDISVIFFRSFSLASHQQTLDNIYHLPLFTKLYKLIQQAEVAMKSPTRRKFSATFSQILLSRFGETISKLI